MLCSSLCRLDNKTVYFPTGRMTQGIHHVFGWSIRLGNCPRGGARVKVNQRLCEVHPGRPCG